MNKIVSSLIVLVFSLVLYHGVLAPSVNAQEAAPSSAFSVEEANKIFTQFGGKKGEVPVTMFVTSWCSVCKALEETFKNNSISYAKADVESSRDAMLFYQKLVQGRVAGVPATLVGKELFMGYDTKSIVQAIKKLRMEKEVKKIDLHKL